MSFNHHIKMQYQTEAGQVVSTDTVYSDNGAPAFNDAIAASQTNKEIDIAFVRANLKSFVFWADQDLTLKTNSSGSPADTIAYKKNTRFVWSNDEYSAIPFSADVTKFYVTTGVNVTNILIFACVHISV